MKDILKIHNKKILLVIDSLKSGGAARQISLIAAGFSKKGFLVHIFFYKHNISQVFYKDLLKDKSLKLFCLENPKIQEGFSLNLVSKLSQLIRKNSYNLILSYQLIPSQYTFLSTLFYFKSSVKIFSLRNSPYTLSKLDFIKILLLTLNFNKLVVNSMVFKKYLCQKNKFFGNHFAEKTKVIFNGYDEFYKSFLSKKRKPSTKKILVIARVNPIKGGVRFAKSMKLFLERNSIDIKIRWAGIIEKNIEGRNEYAKINEIINSSRLLIDSWEWVEHQSNVNYLYDWSDLVVIPSDSEGMSNVLCEAMCRGKFVVSTKVGDYKELIGSDKGIVCSDNSYISLCEALEEFFKLSEDEVIERCRKSYIFAKTFLSIDNTVENYINVLN